MSPRQRSLVTPDKIDGSTLRYEAATTSIHTENATTDSIHYRSQRRPIAHASSSGSQTETPTKPGRKISTTITEGDVKKWMEKGTYGTVGAENWGLEQLVVDVGKRDGSTEQVQAAGAGGEHGGDTGERSDGSSGRQNSGIPTPEHTWKADLVVNGKRCDRCGGVIVWTKAGDYLMVCQQCKEPR